MKTFFQELFTYNDLVNSKMIEVLLHNNQKVPERSMAIASHIFLTHLSWNNRLVQKEGLTNFWETIDPEHLKKLNTDTTVASLKVINEHELSELCEYKNSKGISFKNKYSDVLFHIINHSSYHRGQINIQLRKAGIEPFINEFIYYKR